MKKHKVVCTIRLDADTAALLGRVLNACMFGGEHEFPQEFWTEREYDLMCWFQEQLS